MVVLKILAIGYFLFQECTDVLELWFPLRNHVFKQNQKFAPEW